jgi:hypothetical protein
VAGFEGSPELAVLWFPEHTHFREGAVEPVDVLLALGKRDVEVGGRAPPSTQLRADPTEDDQLDPVLHQDPEQRLLVGGEGFRNRKRVVRTALLVICLHRERP